MRRLAPVLGLLLVAARPTARLAPGPAELQASLEETTRRVERAESIEIAVTRLHDAWGDALAAGTAPPRPCDDPAAESLLARMAVFGPAWRDAAQAARAERDRLVEIAGSPTVQPLLDPALQASVDAVRERVAAQETAYREAVAWQAAWGRAKGCDLALESAPGLPSKLPRPPGEARPAAVVAVGGGVVCPGGTPANGQVLVIAGPICVQRAGPCTCEGRPVDPAAVLGTP